MMMIMIKNRDVVSSTLFFSTSSSGFHFLFLLLSGGLHFIKPSHCPLLMSS